MARPAPLVRIHDDSGALVAQAEVTVKKREDGPTSGDSTPDRMAQSPWRRRHRRGARADHGSALDSGTRASRADQGVHPPLRPQRVALEAWQRDFTSALATYRRQRAWRVMLAVRKVYDVLARGSWAQRLALLWWIPASLLGRPSGLDAYELNFPAPEDYLTRPK